MATWFILTIVVLITFEILNALQLFDLRKKATKKKRYIPDERYFELRSKIQIFTSLVAIVVFAIGFIGFNLKTSVYDEIDNAAVRLDSIVHKHERNEVARTNQILKLQNQISAQKQIIDSLIFRINTYNKTIDRVFQSKIDSIDYILLQKEYNFKQDYSRRNITGDKRYLTESQSNLLLENEELLNIIYNRIESKKDKYEFSSVTKIRAVSIESYINQNDIYNPIFNLRFEIGIKNEAPLFITLDTDKTFSNELRIFIHEIYREEL